jgi:Peptidase A4 family
MDEMCSGRRQRPGWLARSKARGRTGSPTVGQGAMLVTRGRVRAGVMRWARASAVTGLLAVVGLTAAGAQQARAAASLVTGARYSGYVIHGGPGIPDFYSVSAQFLVPLASCLPGESGNGTYYWVGFQSSVGGLAQTGFTVSCTNGQPVYAGWHIDLGIISLKTIPEPMQPGDTVNASVVCWFGLCAETVQDVTQNNWSDTAVYVAPAGFSGDLLTSVVAESFGGGISSWPVRVTNAVVNSTPIGQFNPEADEQNPANYNGTASIDPSPLDPTGTSFWLSWNGDPEASQARMLQPGSSGTSMLQPRSTG